MQVSKFSILQLAGGARLRHARARTVLDAQIDIVWGVVEARTILENSNARAAMDGLAEATRVQSFLQGIAADVPDVEKRIALWNVLRKKDALQEVCKNGARLYYTPNDVNLSIEDRSGACVSETSSACKL
jgi:hypothetical protein